MVAKNDFVIFKELLNTNNEHTWTPYQFMGVTFFDGEAVLGSDLRRVGNTVTCGIHAFRTIKKTSGFRLSKRNNRWSRLDNLHIAVIPKGTKYYVGANNDIVAEFMIVFNYLEDFIESKYYDKVRGTWYTTPIKKIKEIVEREVARD